MADDFQFAQDFVKGRRKFPVVLTIDYDEYDVSTKPFTRTYPHKLYYIGTDRAVGKEDFAGARCIVYTAPPWLTSYHWRPRLIAALEEIHKKCKGNPFKAKKKKKKSLPRKSLSIERKKIIPRKRL